MGISKNGVLSSDTTNLHCLINNFSESGTTTDWSLGGSLNNGVAVLTGTSPTIQSSAFTVNPDDILAFEFTVSLPTPSTAAGGAGLYLGTTYGYTTRHYSYNHSTGSWVYTATDTNPYFIRAYNSTDVLHVKSYILGKNITIEQIPQPEINKNVTLCALQLTDKTSCYIRSGYNANTSMVINFSNPRIYNVKQFGICENSTAKIGKGYIESSNFYEL